MNNFPDIYALAKRFSVVRKDLSNWHLIRESEQRSGHINGIESLYGTIIAQNGNLALLRRGDDLVLVHANYFVPDMTNAAYERLTSPTASSKVPSKVTRVVKHDPAVEAYLNHLMKQFT